MKNKRKLGFHIPKILQILKRFIRGKIFNKNLLFLRSGVIATFLGVGTSKNLSTKYVLPVFLWRTSCLEFGKVNFQVSCTNTTIWVYCLLNCAKNGQLHTRKKALPLGTRPQQCKPGRLLAHRCL